MPRILACWVGRTDLNAAAGKADVGDGPIVQALKQRDFDEVALLSNYPKQESEPFLHWARGKGKAKISLEHVTLADPTDYSAVYKIADAALNRIKERHDKRTAASEERTALGPIVANDLPDCVERWTAFAAGRDNFVAGALAALRRARQRAEEVAAATGTALIQSVDGKPTRVQPRRRADSVPPK